METPEASTVPRFQLHIHIYVWLGLIVVSTVPFLYISGRLYDVDHYEQGLTSIAAMVVIFQVAFWFARRQCSSAELSAWNGLLLIGAYTAIGVGWISIFLAVAAILVSAVAMVAIALASMFVGGKPRAERGFHRMVHWFWKNRMHQ